MAIRISKSPRVCQVDGCTGKHQYKQIHLGCFTSKIEVAKAYNKKAVELWGEFALLNDV